MSDEAEDADGWQSDIIVTLERDVTIPWNFHVPNQLSVFRAEEHSVHDDTITFFGLSVGPDNTTLEVSKDNIRGMAFLDGDDDV